MDCKYKEDFFLGSHGSIGGSPIVNQDTVWKSEADRTVFDIIIHNDLAAMATVWAWMDKNFDEIHLGQHDKLHTSAR